MLNNLPVIIYQVSLLIWKVGLNNNFLSVIFPFLFSLLDGNLDSVDGSNGATYDSGICTLCWRQTDDQLCKWSNVCWKADKTFHLNQKTISKILFQGLHTFTINLGHSINHWKILLQVTWTAGFGWKFIQTYCFQFQRHHIPPWCRIGSYQVDFPATWKFHPCQMCHQPR